MLSSVLPRLDSRDNFSNVAVRCLFLITLFAIDVGSHIAFADAQDQFRDQSRTLESQIRALGEPRDRCTLEAYIGDGVVVVRTFGPSKMKPGDRLVVVNHVVISKRAEEVIAILRETAPSAVVPITLDRNGELLDIDVQCSNARPTTERLLNGLNLASRGKFDECAAIVVEADNLDTRLASIKAQCASSSRNPKRYDIPKLAVQAITMQIEDARWTPGTRVAVAKQLHAMEGFIIQEFGEGKYQSLIAETRAWPGDEKLYESTEPDWALFRRNSESTLRARLIDPESARFEWPYGFTLGSWRPFLSKAVEGYWTCGSVNARNRMGGYTGSSSFVVVLDPQGRVLFSDMGESKDFDMVAAQCSKSVKLLPGPPPQLAGATAPTATVSVADELKKLVDLKKSGALTDGEFQTAKQRLLGTSAP